MARPVWGGDGVQKTTEELRQVVHGMDADIRLSWLRCIEEYRLSPGRIDRPAILTKAELRDQSEPLDDLLALAAPEIKRLFARLMDSDYLLTVASSAGVNISARCDYQLMGRMESLGIQAGAVWDESRQGTNGIGTCIKLRKSLSVVRDDHFSKPLKGLSCSVVPVLGPGGTLQCIINATTDRETDKRSERILRSILEQSARRIENAHFQRHYRGAQILLLSSDEDFSDPGNEVRLALNERDEIVDATSSLSLLLGVEGRQIIGRPVAAVLGGDYHKCIPGQSAWLASEHPNQPGVYARLTIPQKPAGAEGGSLGGFARLSGSRSGDFDLLRSSVFGQHPDLVLGYSTALRMLRAGTPVVLGGEEGSGQENFAVLLAQALQQQQFHVIRCALDQPSDIARRLADPSLSGVVYIEDATSLPSHLGTAVFRTLTELGPKGPHFIAAIGARDSADAAEALPYLHPFTFLELPPLRRYPNRDHVISMVLESEAVQIGTPLPALSNAVRDILVAHPWNGNFGELRLTVRHLLARCTGPELLVEHLPAHLLPQGAPASSTKETMARAGLMAALEINEWNVSLTATYLGVSRATLNRRIRDFGLVRP